jgi:two-component system, response regulator YesN
LSGYILSGGDRMYHVMICEDENWIRRAMVKMVESLDSPYEVIAEARNGQEALDLIYETWPTVVITDIKMPKRDGLWLVREIKERNLPIASIIITGYDQFDYAQQAIRYGVTDFLLKPVVEEEVSIALNNSENQLKYFHNMHGFLIEIQEFITQLENNINQNCLQKLLCLLKSIFIEKQLTVGERNVVLKILSGKMNDLIENSNPSFERLDFPVLRKEEVYTHFQQLLEIWMQAAKELQKSDMRPVIQNVCDYLQESYFKDLSMKDITEQFHISVSHFSLLFKKYTGQTFVNYLNLLKVSKAKELLAEHDLKVYQIAEMVGFSSTTHFNRVFKQLNGYSPIEYRKIMNL